MSSLSASDLFSVKDLVVVITGGGSGLGLMAARALDANGAKRVYILGRRQSSLEGAAASCPHGSVRPIVADVTSKTDLQRAVDIITEEIGYVNLVFANSGTSGIGHGRIIRKEDGLAGLREVMWQSEPEKFTQTMHVNVTGVFYTAVAFLDLLDKGNQVKNVTQKSQILITTSAGSLIRIPSVGFDYSASKAGSLHLAKVLQTSLAPFKIRVNCMAPGLYPTEMSANNPSLKTSGDGAEAKDPTVEGNMDSSLIPLARTGSESDFAGAMLFLASQAGAYVNGNILLTDGGLVGLVPSSW